MPHPTPKQQIKFLNYLQRIFSEGKFTSSYKYALLMAIADLCVEKGNVGGKTLELKLEDIGEKFIQYYWRQSLPFGKVESKAGIILNQNKGRLPLITTKISSSQNLVGKSIGRFRYTERWAGLLKDVVNVIKDQPLAKLQTLSNQPELYLYTIAVDYNSITLNEGIAYSFRFFHPMILNMVRGAWVSFVMSVRSNNEVLGRITDLEEFLFGSGRGSLGKIRKDLLDRRRGNCFYCENRIHGKGHVDHFVPWALYPFDLGHNFVIADTECNSRKRDYLASDHMLNKWLAFETFHRNELEEIFSSRNMPYDFNASMEVAWWAYEQKENSKSKIWVGDDKMATLNEGWRYLNWPHKVELSFAAE